VEFAELRSARVLPDRANGMRAELRRPKRPIAATGKK